LIANRHPYLQDMDQARVGDDGEVHWVEVCFCTIPLAEERPYWEKYFELLSVTDAHSRANCRDLNGTEPWACCDCDCTKKLEERLAQKWDMFIPTLRKRAGHLVRSSESATTFSLGCKYPAPKGPSRARKNSCKTEATSPWQANHGNSHACFSRAYSSKGSWTISGFFLASSQFNRCFRSAKLTAVHPAVPPWSSPHTCRKMQEPNPGIFDQLCSIMTPNLYRPPTPSIDSELDQSGCLTAARSTMRL